MMTKWKGERLTGVRKTTKASIPTRHRHGPGGRWDMGVRYRLLGLTVAGLCACVGRGGKWK